MLKKLNTYLVTNYPSIWRTKIIYILPATILLSLLTPLNQISSETSLKKLERIYKKIYELEDEERELRKKYLELEEVFYEIDEDEESYNDLHLNQRQEIAKKEFKDLKILYQNKLNRIEKLKVKGDKLDESLKVITVIEEKSRKAIYYATFVLVVLIYVWLYIQYLSTVYLKNYSLLNILSVNTLNFASIFLLFIPLSLLVFFTVENLSEIKGLDSNYRYIYTSFGSLYSQQYYLENLLNIGYLFLFPIIFISVFIRYYSFSEIIITILGGILYTTIIGFSLASSWGFDTFLIVLHFPFLPILSYVIYRLYRKRYGKLTRMLIFLVLGTGHLFIAFIQSILFFPKSTLVFSYSDSYSHYEYIYDSYHTFTFTHWITLYASTFIFMTLLTWYFARALQQPKVVR